MTQQNRSEEAAWSKPFFFAFSGLGLPSRGRRESRKFRTLIHPVLLRVLVLLFCNSCHRSLARILERLSVLERLIVAMWCLYTSCAAATSGRFGKRVCRSKRPKSLVLPKRDKYNPVYRVGDQLAVRGSPVNNGQEIRSARRNQVTKFKCLFVC